ncbi:MAG: CDGSH iron-sulfur domain-containing protein [Alphaproteobacteria bacterium]|nr:CDGSH iron-sulfur domain-containing protein [Alphaproteobacteria bacterium]
MTADIIVQDREELVYLLCEAAEFEHAVMCTYLYAMWSLKREEGEGVTKDELAAIERWRGSLRQVAREEMLHLCLVNNLLAALGSAPHLWKPELPVRPGRFPADVVMKLMPFSAAALDHFLYIERPEGIALEDGKGFEHAQYHRAARADLLSPAAQDYVSQGHLYHGILNGLIRLVEQVGEKKVFVGHAQSQVGGAEFGLPGLFKVIDLASARRAIEEIVIQGEGAPAHSETSHYARFAQIKKELAALKVARPAFEPARNAAANPILNDTAESPDRTPIADPAAAKTVDLGNAIYALMMRTLAQVFSPAPLPAELRIGMAVGSTELMYALQTVGEAATRIPARGAFTAGLTFSLPRSAGQLVQSCASQILSERTQELADAAAALESHVNLGGVAPRLAKLAKRFDELHDIYERSISLTVDAMARAQPGTAGVPPAPAKKSGRDARAPRQEDDPNVATTKDVTVRFDTKRCIHSRHCVLEAPKVFRANTPGTWIHPEAASLEHIAHVAHNCPSGAITYERHDGGAGERAPDVNVVRVRENGPYAVNASVAMGEAAFTRATLCRCGQSKNKPYCDNSHIKANFAATGEPATIESDPLEFRAGPLTIDPLPDGPLQLMGNIEICAGTGRTITRAQNARLCRCGGSTTKPFCDGTHARIGFRS